MIILIGFGVRLGISKSWEVISLTLLIHIKNMLIKENELVYKYVEAMLNRTIVENVKNKARKL